MTAVRDHMIIEEKAAGSEAENTAAKREAGDEDDGKESGRNKI